MIDATYPITGVTWSLELGSSRVEDTEDNLLCQHNAIVLSVWTCRFPLNRTLWHRLLVFPALTLKYSPSNT